MVTIHGHIVPPQDDANCQHVQVKRAQSDRVGQVGTPGGGVPHRCADTPPLRLLVLYSTKLVWRDIALLTGNFLFGQWFTMAMAGAASIGSCCRTRPFLGRKRPSFVCIEPTVHSADINFCHIIDATKLRANIT